jgi:ASPIC and UnbV
LVLTFGLAGTTKADAIEVQWPSGQMDKLSGVAGDQTVTIEEGKGAVGTRAYGKRTIPPAAVKVAKN